MLGDRFYKLPAKEIENLIPEKILQNLSIITFKILKISFAICLLMLSRKIIERLKTNIGCCAACGDSKLFNQSHGTKIEHLRM